MIKINLLPFRAARQKENIRRQVSIFFLLILFSFVVLYFITNSINGKIDTLKGQNTAIKKEIATYKAKADRAAKLKNDLAVLEDKLKIVETLKEDREKPYQLMDQMTGLVIPERMWLTNMSISKTDLKLQGIAFDNPTVADFMDQLEATGLYSDVKLNNTQIQKMNDSTELVQFALSCINKKIDQKNEK